MERVKPDDARAPHSTAPFRPPPPLCGHSSATMVVSGHRIRCGVCGSFWDRRSVDRVIEYDDDYPEVRGHFDVTLGHMKVRTLWWWMRRAGVDPRGRVICETGFGAGFSLAALQARGAHVYGVEVVDANLAHARALGIPTASLLHAERLPARLPLPVDLWLFQDAFEHIPDPSAYADWMLANSARGAEILIVLPQAGSFSERILGRFWPHRVPDHQFHWSARGLVEFWSRYGFALARRFTPVKWVSPSMLLAHGRILRGQAERGEVSARFAFPFNIGEFGGLFERRSS